MDCSGAAIGVRMGKSWYRMTLHPDLEIKRVCCFCRDARCLSHRQVCCLFMHCGLCCLVTLIFEANQMIV
jgi:hypothetical protein